MSSGMGSGGRSWAVVPIAVLGAALSISACDNSPFGTFDLDTGDAGDDSGMGGKDDSGMEPDPTCPDISFVNPVAGRVLDEADDVDLDNCENGFQYDVVVATGAPDGTPGVLYAGATQVGTAVVSGAVLSFEGVQLTSSGQSELSAQVGSDASCKVSRSVNVSCSVPSCAITKPVVSVTHPALNGVSVAEGGDRTSAAGEPYQVAVEVATSIESGQPVELLVDNAAVSLSSLAEDGKAVFAGVTLSPDGAHTLEAVCRGKSGLAGRSAKATYTVDTTPPAITATEPAANTHFNEAATFPVCVTTSSPDAIDLPDALGAAAQRNFCAGVGGSTQTCQAVLGGAGRACVDLACPGGPPFDVRLSLRDAAGNVANALVTGVSCRAGSLGAEIIAPVSSVPGNTATNLLAASASQAVRDSDAALSGAQTTVLVCTDASPATMTLSVGLASDEQLSVLGEPVQVELANVIDGCPAGKPYIARFANVTLPESNENPSGALVAATRLVAHVTDESSSTGSSLPVDLWVDSILPVLGARAPNPLCGHRIQSQDAEVELEVLLLSSVLPLSLTITHANGEPELKTATGYASGTSVSFGKVNFSQGVTALAATSVEPSGNRASLPVPCTVTVGNPPVVTWMTPSLTTKLNAATDADPGTPGWQGTLRVRTDLAGVAGATVQFSTTVTGNLGEPVPVAGNGEASLTVTLPEGSAVQLTATTNDVAERGVGRAFLLVPVDTTIPPAVANLQVTVPEALRRQTGFRMTWAAPDDAGSAVKGYDVRVSAAPITNLTDFNAATLVTYIGSPAQPGQADAALVTDLTIERDYYFAVIAQDAGGNRSELASAGPVRASFNRTVLTGSGGDSEQFGRSVEGSGDLNGDGFADLVVGAGNGSEVSIYFGSASGYPATPSARIAGPSGVQFGLVTEIVGDIDGDGRADLAIGAPQIGDGAVYIFRGRATWPNVLSHTSANYVITVDAEDVPEFSASLFGGSLARVGDYDGDGADDFAIGASRYAGNRGYVAVVRGVRADNGPFPATLSLSSASPRFVATIGATDPARLGWALTGLGRFYPGGGSTLLASAYLYGYAYAFAGSLDIENPADSVVVTPRSAAHGFSVAALGALGSPMAVGIGAPAQGATGGTVRLHLGTTTTGPFVPAPIVLSNSAAGQTGNGFGSCVFGSVISGVGASYSDSKSSFVGSSLPDVAISGLGEGAGPAKLYIIDGQKVPSLVSGQIAAAADVAVSLPVDWINNTGCMPQSRAIRDLNNDGYADLAVAQWRSGASYAGAVLVLW